MNQLQLDEELGKGNYGTVKKVYHKPTNVAMAMKVRPYSSYPPRFSILVLGDSAGTR
jgi:serine/threonine protein kinase